MSNARDRATSLISAIVAGGMSLLGFSIAFTNKPLQVYISTMIIPESWYQLVGRTIT